MTLRIGLLSLGCRCPYAVLKWQPGLRKSQMREVLQVKMPAQGLRRQQLAVRSQRWPVRARRKRVYREVPVREPLRLLHSF